MPLDFLTSKICSHSKEIGTNFQHLKDTMIRFNTYLTDINDSFDDHSDIIINFEETKNISKSK